MLKIDLFLSWVKGFFPEPVSVDFKERTRSCIGAFFGIVLTSVTTYWLIGASDLPLLMAPIGASAVLLFGVPSSPLAQPWSIVGGNTVAALVGVTFAMLIKEPVIAAAFGLSVAIALMFALRCLHPPSGAVALTATIGGPAIHAAGYGFVLFPVFLNSVLLLLVALIYNNATRRTYPHTVVKSADSHLTKDIPPEMRFGFTTEDLNEVLKEYNQVIDVSREDLQTLLQQTEMHAYRRRFGEITCADIMSKDVISVEFGTELEDAWALLRKHKIKALPVVDRAQRVIGIITQIDFMKHANLDVYEGFESKLRRFIQRTARSHSHKPEVAGQIMTSPAVTANMEMHIVGLIPLMSQHRVHHHIPVVDDDRKLVGIVTQSDLVSALYHGRIANIRTLGLSS